MEHPKDTQPEPNPDRIQGAKYGLKSNETASILTLSQSGSSQCPDERPLGNSIRSTLLYLTSLPSNITHIKNILETLYNTALNLISSVGKLKSNYHHIKQYENSARAAEKFS